MLAEYARTYRGRCGKKQLQKIHRLDVKSNRARKRAIRAAGNICKDCCVAPVAVKQLKNGTTKKLRRCRRCLDRDRDHHRKK
ncbi:MAG: hypothetical protein KGL39_50080 [Patescibacteria group bacterium]|nr:hypothetical protein [Patescibacteria group bacterium]